MNEPLHFRIARSEDLESIVKLLADDPLGAKRERYEIPLPQSYRDAFDTIDRDPNNELVGLFLNGRLSGRSNVGVIWCN